MPNPGQECSSPRSASPDHQRSSSLTGLLLTNRGQMGPGRTLFTRENGNDQGFFALVIWCRRTGRQVHVPVTGVCWIRRWPGRSPDRPAPHERRSRDSRRLSDEAAQPLQARPLRAAVTRRRTMALVPGRQARNLCASPRLARARPPLTTMQWADRHTESRTSHWRLAESVH